MTHNAAASTALVQTAQISSGVAAVVAVGLAIVTLILLRSDDALQPQDEAEAGPHAPPEQVAHIAPTRLEGATE